MSALPADMAYRATVYPSWFAVVRELLQHSRGDKKRTKCPGADSLQRRLPVQRTRFSSLRVGRVAWLVVSCNLLRSSHRVFDLGRYRRSNN